MKKEKSNVVIIIQKSLMPLEILFNFVLILNLIIHLAIRSHGKYSVVTRNCGMRKGGGIKRK